MKIPFFGISREYIKYKNEYLDLVNATFSHGQVLRGEEVVQLENETAKLCGRTFAIAVGSATDALYFSLLATGIKHGDEVLVTDFSFIASASCILRIGAIPVFVDIGYDYNMDLKKAEEKITSKTKAIIAVHLYGQMINPENLIKFAKDNGLILIEDASQSIGANFLNTQSGSIGEVSCFSFDPTKVIGANGSGGIILTDDQKINSYAKKVRYHGKNDEGDFEFLGFNSQLPSVMANLLLFKIGKEEEWFKKRLNVARIYTEGLKNVGDIIAPEIYDDKRHIFHKYVIRTKNRKRVMTKMKDDGIQCMIHYVSPLHKYSCFNHLKNDKYEISEKFSREVCSLPIHPFLEDNEIQYIIDSIKSAF